MPVAWLVTNRSAFVARASLGHGRRSGPPAGTLQSRYGIEEFARVGVLASAGIYFRGIVSDNPAAQHNDDAWCDEIHKLQIVPYEDDGKAQLLLQVQQQVTTCA